MYRHQCLPCLTASTTQPRNRRPLAHCSDPAIAFGCYVVDFTAAHCHLEYECGQSAHQCSPAERLLALAPDLVVFLLRGSEAAYSVWRKSSRSCRKSRRSLLRGRNCKSCMCRTPSPAETLHLLAAHHQNSPHDLFHSRWIIPHKTPNCADADLELHREVYHRLRPLFTSKVTPARWHRL